MAATPWMAEGIDHTTSHGQENNFLIPDQREIQIAGTILVVKSLRFAMLNKKVGLMMPTPTITTIP